MKKVLVGLFFLLILLFFVVFVTLFRKNTVEYRLNNKTYQLLVADTAQEWERGLMYREKLENADGMIFIFPDKQKRGFWNKNTLVDLGVYWLDGDTIVGKTVLPSIEKSKKETYIYSPKPVDKVIEIVKE